VEPQDLPFGTLLKRYRQAAFLSQETLAARAGVSVRAISDLERGIKHSPQRRTLALLVGALGLSAAQAKELQGAASRKRAQAGNLEPGPLRQGSPAAGGNSLLGDHGSAALPSPPMQYEGGRDARAPSTHTARPGESSAHAGTPALHNLPRALTSFIGREQERVTVRLLLDGSRLITLTGIGGCGKTRLALEVAAISGDAYPDGVWLVELAAMAGASAGGAALLPGAVAQVLGVREDPGSPLQVTLAEHLREKEVLLVLDNCEHLIEPCAELVDWLLRQCVWLRILATSREELRVPGEQLYQVPPLSLPGMAAPLAEIGASEAVQLFVERARARTSGFDLTVDNAMAIVQICRRLDGIPLAIELAAARTSLLAPREIAARLDDRFQLLSVGPRTVPPRQQTLRAALDWSHDLLSPPEQALLRRLSVLADGWMLDAAEALGVAMQGESVAGDRGPARDDTPTSDMGVPVAGEVFELLAQLVARSLVTVEDQAPGLRYRLLETVRQYAEERLQSSGEAEALHRRHALYFLNLAEQAAPALTGPRQIEWLARLALEHENMRAALRWSQQGGEIELGLRLAGALWRFWYVRGYLGEGRQWLEALLALAESGAGPIAARVRARACAGAGILASIQGDSDRATTLLQRSLRLWREQGDQQGIAGSLRSLANVAYYRGGYDEAVPLYRESLALYRTLQDREGIARTLNNLGTIAEMQGSYREAATLLEESLSLARALGGQQDMANALFNLGSVLARLGNTEQAIGLLEESLVLYQELGDRLGTVFALQRLGEEATRRGDGEHAMALHRQSLTLARDLGQKEFIAWNLEGLAAVAMLQWRQRPLNERVHVPEGPDLPAHGVTQHQEQASAGPVHAARLLGAAAALRHTINTPVPPAEPPAYSRLLQEVRGTSDGASFAAAWEAGQATALDEVVAAALSTEP
jgi:predicted ATPase/transcriptional regulator with XRE-family HTH domain